MIASSIGGGTAGEMQRHGGRHLCHRSIIHLQSDRALEPQAEADIREGIGRIVVQTPADANTDFEVR